MLDLSEIELTELKNLLAEARANAPIAPNALRRPDGSWIARRCDQLGRSLEPVRGLPWLDGKPLLDAGEREQYFKDRAAAAAREKARIERICAEQRAANEANFVRKTGHHSQYVGLGASDLNNLKPATI